MSPKQDRQIAALAAISREYGAGATVKDIEQQFRALGSTDEYSRNLAKHALETSNKFSKEELEDLVADIESKGFDSVDYFEFAMHWSLTPALLAAAQARYDDGSPTGMVATESKTSLASQPVPPRSTVKPALSSSKLPTPAPSFATGQFEAPGLPSKSFAVHLIHQFPLVSGQVENGLYAVKRVAAYLKKICAFEEQYAKEIDKATVHETSKFDRVQGDGMKRYVDAWTSLQEVMFQSAHQHEEFRNKVTSAVILPLQAFYKEGETRRKEILTEMTNLSKQMKVVNDSVKKAREKAMGLLEDLRDAMDREKGIAPKKVEEAKGGVFSRLAAKFKEATAEPVEVLREKAQNACTAFKQAIDAANLRKKTFREKELPQVFKQMDELEIARLDVLKEHLTKFALIFHEMIAPMEELSSRLVQNIQAMNTNEDMDTFIMHWLDIHGEPTAEAQYKYNLPTTADDLRRLRWNGNLETKTDSNSVFGATLLECMTMQKEKHPNATVPLILTTLIQAIRQLDGPKAEGIFRISANKGELDALHVNFDKGIYEVHSDSPHVPAGLLKEWLRELAEPLVPHDMYQECVDAAKGENFSKEVAFGIFQRLPELTQRVVQELTILLSEIVRHSDVNRMSVDNLAIVFAPSLLRCESDDPMEMLQNAKFETAFTSALLAGLIERSRK